MLWVIGVLATLALGLTGAIILTKTFLEIPEEREDKNGKLPITGSARP
jgi:hypothetical protein